MARDFQSALKEAAAIAQGEIEARLHLKQTVIPEAMIYATKGGKALRAFLVLEGARLHEISIKTAAPAAGSIEAMHAYSLVHDDLPCMDDDDVRRGQPTVHRKWDEATAVLAGDALQALSFELLMYADTTDAAKLHLVHTLAVMSGAQGMVGGQAMDIAAETRPEPLDITGIEQLQDRKTGALIKWAADAGPTLAGAEVRALSDYGSALGRAFQIADDILDVEGDAAEVGKATQKDADAGKATFVSLLGLDEAKRRAKSLVDAACDALSPYGENADVLREAAHFVVNRTK